MGRRGGLLLARAAGCVVRAARGRGPGGQGRRARGTGRGAQAGRERGGQHSLSWGARHQLSAARRAARLRRQAGPAAKQASRPRCCEATREADQCPAPPASNQGAPSRPRPPASAGAVARSCLTGDTSSCLRRAPAGSARAAGCCAPAPLRAAPRMLCLRPRSAPARRQLGARRALGFWERLLLGPAVAAGSKRTVRFRLCSGVVWQGAGGASWSSGGGRGALLGAVTSG